MTPEDRTPYAEGRLHLQTFTSAYGVTTVRFEHGPLQFSFTSHEHPLTHLEVDPQGRLRLWLQYCRIRLKFDLFSPPDESGYHEQLLQYRTASYSHQDIEEEEDVKITCRPVQEKGYDQPAEIALDSRSTYYYHHQHQHHHQHWHPSPLPMAPAPAPAPAPAHPPYQYAVEEQQSYDAAKSQLVGISNLPLKLPTN